MDATRIGQWAAALGTKITGKRQHWLTLSCPLAGVRHEKGTDRNPSFGVKVEAGDSRVHCLSCNFSGTQSSLLLEMRARGMRADYATAFALIDAAEEGAPLAFGGGDYEAQFEVPAEYEFPDWLLEAFEPAYADGQVHPYLAGRAGGPVPYAVAELLDLRFDPHKNRVLFPVRDFDGVLRGLHGRAVDGQKPPYLMYTHEGHSNPNVWLGEDRLDADRPVVIAESVFDLARVLEVYPNVVSPMSASLSKPKVARILGVEEIVTLFDSDKAGHEARKRLRGGLPDATVRDLLPTAGKKDAGEMTASEIRSLLSGAGLL